MRPKEDGAILPKRAEPSQDALVTQGAELRAGRGRGSTAPSTPNPSAQRTKSPLFSSKASFCGFRPLISCSHGTFGSDRASSAASCPSGAPATAWWPAWRARDWPDCGLRSAPPLHPQTPLLHLPAPPPMAPPLCAPPAQGTCPTLIPTPAQFSTSQ